jgi:hypothetical protein
MPAVNWGILWLLLQTGGRLAQVPGARHPFAGLIFSRRGFFKALNAKGKRLAVAFRVNPSRSRSGFAILSTCGRA